MDAYGSHRVAVTAAVSQHDVGCFHVSAARATRGGESRDSVPSVQVPPLMPGKDSEWLSTWLSGECCAQRERVPPVVAVAS